MSLQCMTWKLDWISNSIGISDKTHVTGLSHIHGYLLKRHTIFLFNNKRADVNNKHVKCTEST